MNIHKASQSYENWMRSCTAVIEAHLRLKHRQMRESPFLFFRGSFYRWAQLWPDVCASLRDAPKVLAPPSETSALATVTNPLCSRASLRYVC